MSPSKRKSKELVEGGCEAAANGNTVSSKTTCQEMMIRRVDMSNSGIPYGRRDSRGHASCRARRELMRGGGL
jgi:hypothetical protein